MPILQKCARLWYSTKATCVQCTLYNVHTYTYLARSIHNVVGGLVSIEYERILKQEDWCKPDNMIIFLKANGFVIPMKTHIRTSLDHIHDQRRPLGSKLPHHRSYN